MTGFYRFLVHGTGIYEAVEGECPRTDLRRSNKPDGSWLPRVGTKYPGAISFWTEFGLEKYLQSGLQEWHRSVVSQPLTIAYTENISIPLYADEYQVICSSSQETQEIPWNEWTKARKIPIVDKVVAYIVDAGAQNILVFEHDKKWSEAGIQVPAGTVDENEDLANAALREALEESGLQDLSIIRNLDEYVLFRNTHSQYNRRHVYIMSSKSSLGKTWSHAVTGNGDDEGMNYHYSWMPLSEARYKLAGSFGSSIHKLEMLPLLQMADADPNLSGYVYPENFEINRFPIRNVAGEMAGFFTPRLDKDGVWRMGALFVRPEDRAKGLARESISAFMRSRKGRAFIEHENISSQKAYLAAGFTKKQADQNNEGFWWENF